MSLQTSSHPKARSLIVFLLSVISLGSILTQFSDIQDEVRDLPHLVRAVDEVSALDHIHNSSNDFQNHDDNFFPDQMSTQKSPKNKGYRCQNKFIFKGCRKNKIESGKKGLVSHEIFGLNQLKIEIF